MNENNLKDKEKDVEKDKNGLNFSFIDTEKKIKDLTKLFSTNPYETQPKPSVKKEEEVQVVVEKITKDSVSLIRLYSLFKASFVYMLANKFKKLKKKQIYNKILDNVNKYHRIKAFVNLKEQVQLKKLNREYLRELLKERVNKLEINFSHKSGQIVSLPQMITYNDIKIELLNKLKDDLLKILASSNNTQKPRKHYHLKVSFFTEKIIFSRLKLFEDFFNIDNKKVTFSEMPNCFTIQDLDNELTIANSKVCISFIFSFVFIYPFTNFDKVLSIPGMFNFSYGVVLLDFSNDQMIKILMDLFQDKLMKIRKKKLVLFSVFDKFTFPYIEENIKIFKDLLRMSYENNDKTVYEMLLPDFHGVTQVNKIKFINNYELYNMFMDIIEIKPVPILEKLDLNEAFTKIIDVDLISKQRDKIQSQVVKDLKSIKNKYWREFFIYVSRFVLLHY